MPEVSSVQKKGLAPSSVRNIAVVGHRSAGKTSLADMLLHAAGVTRTVGRVDEGSSLLDHSAEARDARQTLEIATAWLPWGESAVYLVDTPGAQDLLLDAERALYQVDAALLCLAGNDGVPHGASRMLQVADRLRLPMLAVVHQADRPHALDALLHDLRAITERRVLLLQLPFHDDSGAFAGVIDLLTRRALRFDPEGSGAFSPEPIPSRLRDAVEAARDRLVEAAALDDEDLLERYLEFLELPDDVVVAALARSVRDGRTMPVAFTSAAAVAGAAPLLDAIIDLLPSPQQTTRVDAPRDGSFAATVLHTTIDDEGRPCALLRVWSGDALDVREWTHGESGEKVKIRKLYSVRGPRRATAVHTGPGAILATWDRVDARPGETLTDRERYALRRPPLPPVMVRRRLAPDGGQDPKALAVAIDVLLQMDHALDLERDPDGRPVLGARSPGQVERALRWLKARMGARVRARSPDVAYREIPANGTSGVEGVHLREAGGLVEEFGRCALDLDPLPRPDGLDFSARVDAEDLPERFVGAVCQGALEAAREGPLAGFPVIGARVTCVAGEYDILSSTEEHFRIAGAHAMRAALTATGTRLAEPWVLVEVHAPADAVRAVLDALTGRRARIVDVAVDREARVVASCPERETFDLAGRLAAVTGGRAWFSTERSHYDLLPDGLVPEALRGRGAEPLLRRVGS
jgi:elongation factor G